jgi:hypothetical protein
MKQFSILSLGFVIFGLVTGCTPIDYSTETFGYLEGQVTIGPICPVERPDKPCPVPPEAYAAREVWVLQGNQLVSRAGLSNTGGYWLALPPGRYTVDIKRAGIDRSADVPKEIEIQRGKTVRLDIEIDTGIR